jgi:hypothetical protein
MKSRIENDFTFIVDEHHYICPCFIAEFLSPKVSHHREFDGTKNELIIETKDCEHDFESILSLGCGSQLSLKDLNHSFCLSIAKELWNWELYFCLYDMINDNVPICTFCKEFGDCEMFENLPDRAIEFISSHFFEIESSFIDIFSISNLSQILSHPSLQLSNEDSLYTLIRNHFESNPHYIELLCYIRFEFLSIDSIQNFISWSCEHFNEFEDSFSQELWTSICGRLCLSISSKCVERRYSIRELKFSPTSASSLDGIIGYLTKKHGGNVHDQGIIEVSSSTANGSLLGKNAANLLSHDYFHSMNVSNQWLCYDFKTLKVRPTHYSVHTYHGNLHLRFWVLEGSMDGSKWTELDQRNNNATTNDEHPIGTFTVSNVYECRFIRLRQTGKNARGDDYFLLFAFEIFGYLTNSD